MQKKSIEIKICDRLPQFERVRVLISSSSSRLEWRAPLLIPLSTRILEINEINSESSLAHACVVSI